MPSPPSAGTPVACASFCTPAGCACPLCQWCWINHCCWEHRNGRSPQVHLHILRGLRQSLPIGLLAPIDHDIQACSHIFYIGHQLVGSRAKMISILQKSWISGSVVQPLHPRNSFFLRLAQQRDLQEPVRIHCHQGLHIWCLLSGYQ